MNSCRQAGIGIYTGESYRPLNDQFTEHLRSAKNPTAASYKDKPLAKHNAQHRLGLTPELSLKTIVKLDYI